MTEGQEPTTEVQATQDDRPQDGQTETAAAQAAEQQVFDAEYVKKLRQEAAGYRTQLRDMQRAEEERAKATEEAEAKQLADQQKWRELAEKRTKEIDGLKPYKEQAERYNAALLAILKAQRQGLPDHMIELLDRLDPVDQLEWIAKHGESAARPRAPQTNAAAPIGVKPQADPQEKITELRQRFGF